MYAANIHHNDDILFRCILRADIVSNWIHLEAVLFRIKWVLLFSKFCVLRPTKMNQIVDVLHISLGRNKSLTAAHHHHHHHHPSTNLTRTTLLMRVVSRFSWISTHGIHWSWAEGLNEFHWFPFTWMFNWISAPEWHWKLLQRNCVTGKQCDSRWKTLFHTAAPSFSAAHSKLNLLCVTTPQISVKC